MKKKVLLLFYVLPIFSVQEVQTPIDLSQQERQGWYDWSKQKAQQYIPYVPGAITGLSGASLLALQGIYGSEKPKSFWDTDDIDEILTYLAGSPVIAYELARGLIPYYLYGDIDASGNARDKMFEFLINHNALKAYAPYLLGTSAALFAAPYLYRKYQEYQREIHKPKAPSPK